MTLSAFSRTIEARRPQAYHFFSIFHILDLMTHVLYPRADVGRMVIHRRYYKFCSFTWDGFIVNSLVQVIRGAWTRSNFWIVQ